MPSRVIASSFLCSNIAQVVSFSSIFLRLVDSRRMPPDSMHPIYSWPCITCTLKIFSTEIWNQRTFLWVTTDTSKLLISVCLRKTSLGIMMPRVFVEQPSTLLLRFFSIKVMEKLLTGGHSEESSTRCFVVSLLSTAKIRRSSSEISNTVTQDLILDSLVRMPEISAASFLTKIQQLDLDQAQLTLKKSWLIHGSPASTGMRYTKRNNKHPTNHNWTTNTAPSTSLKNSLRCSWLPRMSRVWKTTANGLTLLTKTAQLDWSK